MSTSIKLLAAFGVIAFVAACASEPQVGEPAPISVEPVQTGKYK
jgi:hypothetical protein